MRNRLSEITRLLYQKDYKETQVRYLCLRHNVPYSILPISMKKIPTTKHAKIVKKKEKRKIIDVIAVATGDEMSRCKVQQSAK